MSLRIAWASPWGERCRVAAFGAAVVSELLSRGHEVAVIRTEVGLRRRERGHRSRAEVHAWHRARVRELVQSADGVVVNLCDDYSACGTVLEDLASFGALGIVHDRSLQALVAGWLRRLRNRAAATGVLGDADAWVGAALAGALLHDEENFTRIAAACAGPVALRPSPDDIGAYADALLGLLSEVIARRPLIMAGLALGKIIAGLDCAPDAARVQACGARLAGLFGSA